MQAIWGLLMSRHCTALLLTVVVVFSAYDLLSQRSSANMAAAPGGGAPSDAEARRRRRPTKPDEAAEGDVLLQPLLSRRGSSSSTSTAASRADSPKIGAAAADAPAAAGAGGEMKWTHIHVCALGDSMTEGIARVINNPRKLKYFPYAPMVAEMLRGHVGVLSSSRVASVSHHTLAFRGKTAGGILYDSSKKIFGPNVEFNTSREPLLSELLSKKKPSAGVMGSTPKVQVVSPGLMKVLTTGRTVMEPRNWSAFPPATGGGAPSTATAADGPAALFQDVPVEQVMIVCAVMAGTNDVLRAEGSTVASPSLPSIPVADTLSNILDLLTLCVRYHTQMRIEQQQQQQQHPSAGAGGGPTVNFLLLPMGLPPVMFDPSSEVLRDLIMPFLARQPGRRTLFGYCLTPFASWRPMNALRDDIHNRLISPGQFHNELERLALTLHHQAALLGAGVAATKDVAQFDDVLVDRQALWTDCLHLSEAGYEAMARRIVGVIREQT